MRPLSRTAHQIVAAIAGANHGVVTREQLLAAGLTADQIRYRVRLGLLIRLYPGVYRVGHAAPSMEASYMAAVRACGDGALLCNRAAGHLLGLLKGDEPAPEVLTPTERRVAGIITRRCRRIHPLDSTTVRAIPVTTVPRTLVDFAADFTLTDLARACHEAGIRYRTKPKHVDAVLRRRPNAPGAANLRLVIHGDARVTLSRLEAAFLSLLKDAGLPLPITNKIAGTKRVDCRWPEHKLTVELDSFTFHNSRYAWEQGYERERQARKRKERFRRFTWADVFEDPAYMLGELRRLTYVRT